MLGFISGSGLYKISDPSVTIMEEYFPETKFGFPSGKIQKLSFRGKEFFFLPRHGKNHEWPPHRLPYRANFEAFRMLGVTHIIAHCVSGSLKKVLKPGSFVVLDQFVDFTKRVDDFEPVHEFVHLPISDPYCEKTSSIISETLSALKLSFVGTGTIVVIEGPRFSTLAESMMYINQGWDVINMTQYPECYLAREYGMNYAAITSITDYNVGLQQIEHEITPSGYSKVKNLFKKNAKSSQKILLALVSKQDQILAIPKVSVTFKEFFRK